MAAQTLGNSVMDVGTDKVLPGLLLGAVSNEGRRAVEELTSALAADTKGRLEEWCSNLRQALRDVIKQMPTDAHLLRRRVPGAGQETPMNAALHYRVAAEFIRCFAEQRPGGTPENPATLSPGMLLDLWEIWWRTLTPEVPDLVRDSDPEQGRVVEPILIRDALCGCDPDVRRWLLRAEDVQSYGHKKSLKTQIWWQLRQLTRTKPAFSKADRAVLYELLRQFHYRIADVTTGQCADAVRILVEAGEAFRESVETKGNVPLPESPEAVFLAFDDELSDEDRSAGSRTIDALQVFFSHALIEGASFDSLVRHVVEAAVTLEIRPEAETAHLEPALRRMLLFWAARSRILRYALEDLLNYRFPETTSIPPQPQAVFTGCECWVAVVGYRQRGKTSFMRSLVAGLTPDGTKLQKGVDWSKSRVRLLRTDAFGPARDRQEVIKESRKAAKNDLDNWLMDHKEPGTPRTPPFVAEIDTGHLARLCFFDVMGESMFDEAVGMMEKTTRRLLESRRPVAAIFVDSQYLGSRQENDRVTPPANFTQIIAGEKAPVYIVVNKYDMFRDDYEGDARREMDRSLAYEDAPEAHDADYHTKSEPFFSLRQIDFGKDGTPTIDDIKRQIEDMPSLARRPHYQQRLLTDIERLGPLFSDLLQKGRRDISLVYLISTPDGRGKPEDFRGLRNLWEDLEGRVIESTSKSRREALKKLLIETPAKQDTEATKVYGGLEFFFNSPDTLAPGKLSDTWEQFEAGLRTAVYKQHVEEEKASCLFDALKTLRSFLAQHRARRSALDSSLKAFLPELGIKPDRRQADLPTAFAELDYPRDGKIEEALKEVASIVREALQEKGIGTIGNEENYQVQIGRLLASVIMPAASEGGMTETNSRNGVTFDLTGNGTELSQGARGLGAARGPALRYAHRGVLLSLRGSKIPGDRTVEEWIFDSRGGARSDDRRLVLEALYNVEGAETTRYRDLLLEEGEFDFCRVRVLSETTEIDEHVPVLGRRFNDFQRQAVETMALLIRHAREARNLSDELLEDAFMASAIHFALVHSFNMDLPAIDDLLDLPNNEGGENDEEANEVKDAIGILSDKISRGSDLHTDISNLVNRWNPRGALLLNGKWNDVVNIHGEYPNLWAELDSGSKAVVSEGRITFRARRRIKREVGRAPVRIKVKLNLLSDLKAALDNTARNLRNIHSEARNVVLDCLKEAFGTKGQGPWAETDAEKILSKVWVWDASLPGKLRTLRIKRRLLIAGYPLLYLTMNRWIASSYACAPAGKLKDWLQEAQQALTRAGEDFDEAWARISGGVQDNAQIGSPDFPWLQLRREGERQWIDDQRNNWSTLAERLGLNSGEGKAALWGDKP